MAGARGQGYWVVRVVLALSCLCALATAATLAAGPANAGSGVSRCTPTLPDGFGPFGRGMPPIRAKIGTGHVLTGVILSEVGCRPLRGAQVQFWQSNRDGVYTRATSATVITDRLGRFRFEGPYPASYEGRTPHIHIRVVAAAHRQLLARYVPAKGARTGHVRLVLQVALL